MSRSHVENIATGAHKYIVVHGGTMDGTNCRSPMGCGMNREGAIEQTWQSNRAVRMENVGQTDVVDPWLSNGRNNFRDIKEIVMDPEAPEQAVEQREAAVVQVQNGKLGELDARFRNHTVALFQKHGFTNLGYYHPMDANKGAANTLIYFLAFPDKEAADKSWKAFRDDPDWQKVVTESQKNGKLTTKAPDSVYMKATDFSAIK